MNVDAHQLIGAIAQGEPRFEIGNEMERIELNEQVVAEEAVDVQPASLRVELDTRAGLHRVRRDREIGLAGQTRVIAREERNTEPPQSAQVRRDFVKRRMKAADRENKDRLVAPADAQR